MTREQALELFSDYREQTLEPGLRSQLERALSSDPALSEEYDLYSQAIGQLEVLRTEKVEVPADLHERISQRMDRYYYERDQKRRAVPFLAAWRRGLVGGLVGVALFWGGVALFQRPSGDSFGANLAGEVSHPSPRSGVPMRAVAGEKGLHIEVRLPEADEIRVLRLQDGVTLGQFSANANQMVSIPLANNGEAPSRISVEAAKSRQSILVVVPGSVKTPVLEGSGTMLDFATALSRTYGLPVVLDEQTLDRTLRWKLDPATAVRPELSEATISVDLQDGTLRVRG